MESRVIEGPFCEREARALFGRGDEERVGGEFVAIDQVERLADLSVEVGRFGQVAAHGVTGFRSIDERLGQRDRFGGIAAGVALVPRGVWLVGGDEEAEGRSAGGAVCYEGFDGLEVGAVAFAQVFEREDGGWLDMRLAAEGYAVAEGLQVVDNAGRFRIGKGVIWVGARLERRLSRVYIVAGGRAGRR